MDDTSDEGVAQAIRLASDPALMRAATDDELMSAAYFLSQALSQFPESAPLGFRESRFRTELMRAGSAVSVELKLRYAALRSRAENGPPIDQLVAPATSFPSTLAKSYTAAFSNEPGFVECKVRGVGPTVLAYVFETAEDATAFQRRATRCGMNCELAPEDGKIVLHSI